MTPGKKFITQHLLFTLSSQVTFYLKNAPAATHPPCSKTFQFQGNGRHTEVTGMHV